MSKPKVLLLAAGLGMRLRPLTDQCPKCLVPILGRPLLEYWLYKLAAGGLTDVFVNVHHHREMVTEFLARKIFKPWVNVIVEEELSGTAGTLRNNIQHFRDSTTFVAHADNWCHFNLNSFIDFHANQRPDQALISMMTFRTVSPQSCGIVKVDDRGIVKEFFEKEVDPPGNMANGAVYIIEPEVSEWISTTPKILDFSNDVIPEFLGRIAIWENRSIHRDIGSVRSLLAAQTDPPMSDCWPVDIDDWHREYAQNPIHEQIAELEE